MKTVSKRDLNAFKKKCYILAIESSCDETSAAVVNCGREVLSNVVLSQIDIHKKFGGVVPEVASRNHIMAINNVVNEALEKANVTKADIDAVAVTYGAGLIGALMVGVNYAKALATSLNVPLIAVNHIRGHIAANYIIDKSLTPPFNALVVSGGHTALLEIKNYTKQKMIMSTLDDAVGECYDKVARVLKLSYPGGPNVDRLAKQGNNLITLNYHDRDKNNFSYSGLKTAVVNFVANKTDKGEEFSSADVAYTFQTLAVKQLVEKVVPKVAATRAKTLVICGGVSANSYLREEFKNACDKENIKLIVPPLNLCTDNAAMIGSEAYFKLLSEGAKACADDNLVAVANLPL